MKACRHEIILSKSRMILSLPAIETVTQNRWIERSTENPRVKSFFALELETFQLLPTLNVYEKQDAF